MFVRWKRRQKVSRRKGKVCPTGKWSRMAVLVRSDREDGKVRQRFICHLGTIAEDRLADVFSQTQFWRAVGKKLIPMDLPDEDRYRIEQTLAAVISFPTKEARLAAEAELARLTASIRERL